MKTEEKRAALIEKMGAEKERFQTWLFSQPAEEVLRHRNELDLYSDIFVVAKDVELTEAQTDALFCMAEPLADLVKGFRECEAGHGGDIEDYITTRADKEVKKIEEAREAMRSLPVYPHSGVYAMEHDELNEYLVSYLANVACRGAIEGAVANHYDGYRLDKAAVRQIVDTFGYDRTFHICGHSIRLQEWDGRISNGNTQWARSMNLEDDLDTLGKKCQTDYTLNGISAGLLNLFVNALRREYLLTQPLETSEIVKEAKRVYTHLKEMREPNSFAGNRFSERVSPDFMRRASTADMDALRKLIPFQPLTFSPIDGRDGMFATLPKDAVRSKPFREPRPSVLAKLKNTPAPTSPKHSAKLREQER